jgi:hypothetical protein
MIVLLGMSLGRKLAMVSTIELAFLLYTLPITIPFTSTHRIEAEEEGRVIWLAVIFPVLLT